MTAIELASSYRSGRLSPTEIAESTLLRIESFNPRLNAIVTMDTRAIRRDAAASAERFRAGAPLGPLDGVPLVVKDCIHVRGLPTAWGTLLFKDNVQEKDEQPVARLRQSGMIILGKTNVPEFALRGFTNNPTFGPTRNPWDTDLTVGGSSGGTVSAIAAGFAPIGIGADAGGSIWRPAGFTGLVGLKPSAGRVPRRDALPAIVSDLDVAGPIARTVADLTLAYEIMALPDLGVPSSYAFGRESRRFDLQRPPESQRILFIEQFRDSPVDREVMAAVSKAAENLAALGHQVVTGKAPFDTTAFGRCFGPISRAGLAWATQGRPWQEQVTEEFRQSIEAGLKVSAVEYLEALDVVRCFREEIAAAYEHVDIIMTPSSATLPWAATERAPETINGEPADAGAHSVFTGFANISGYPGINIPADPSANGLPIGFQLVGRYGDEALLLRLARQYETAHPWADRRPALS